MTLESGFKHFFDFCFKFSKFSNFSKNKTFVRFFSYCTTLQNYYTNHELMHNIMLENMLKIANPGMLNNVPRCNEILSDLAYKTNMAFRELTIYLTVFGSWSNGFIYYPPDGFIKNTDSHAYQFGLRYWVKIRAWKQ